MKFYSSQDKFNFSWDQVALAFWNRYPNPYSSHVKSVDTISRHVVGHKLYTKRLLAKTRKIPRWASSFVPRSLEYIVEESVVDAQNKTITTYTRNIGMTKVALVEEKCQYQPRKEEDGLTDCQRQVWVSSNLYGLARTLQSFVMSSFQKSLADTAKGWDWTLTRMYSHVLMPDSSVPTQEKKLNLAAEKIKDSAKKEREKLKESAKIAKQMATNKAASLYASSTSKV